MRYLSENFEFMVERHDEAEDPADGLNTGRQFGDACSELHSSESFDCQQNDADGGYALVCEKSNVCKQHLRSGDACIGFEGCK